MPKVTTSINNFTAGEISKLALGRYDISKYANAVKKMENFLPNQLGGTSFRPGTRYIAGTKYSTQKARLIPFQYSAEQDYVVEMGDEYMRFFSNDADVIDAAAAWDTYYKLMLHGDGTDLATTITDEIGKTVTNTAAYDTYTKLCSKFDGNNGATAYTDPIAGAYTFVGTAQLSTAQKKFGTASLLLDGDSDYVTLPDSASWDFDTGAFTIDIWIRPSDVSTNYRIFFDSRAADNSAGFSLSIDNARHLLMADTGARITGTTALQVNTLYHVTLIGNGGSAGSRTIKLYLNGTQEGSTATIDYNYAGTRTLKLGVANDSTNYFFSGYIDEVRISKGIARWTTDFTPPVAPYGQVTIDTGVKKFGTGSMLFDGSGSYLSLADSDDWDFGTGDFTIDFQVRWNGSVTGSDLLSQWSGVGQRAWQIGFASNVLHFRYSVDGGTTSVDLTFNWTPVADTFYHVSIVRNGNNLYARINGVQIGTTADVTGVTMFNSTSVVAIGIGTVAEGAIYGYHNGYIDELRISKGVARWTANFTAPTSAYEKTVEPLELLTLCFDEDDIDDVHFAQHNDVMWLTHPDYPPRKLSRTSTTVFSMALVSFVRGPFLDTNITAITITPNVNAGAVTLTASSGDIFHYDNTVAADAQDLVDSLFRVKSGVVKILTVASATSATGTVQAEPDGSAGDLGTGVGFTPTTDWAEGAFSVYRGFPATVAFHEQRIYFAATAHEPQKLWGSTVQAYDSFDAGAAADDDAVTFELVTGQRNQIRWLSSGRKSLDVGTMGGTYPGAPADGGMITATNPPVFSYDANYGVAVIQPKKISSYSYYIQRNLHKLRELSYYYDIDAQRSLDMTLLADHILKDGNGAKEIDHQQSPNDRIWCVRSDGQLAILTRNPEQEVMGWARFVAGEDSTGDGVFESVVVIPKQSDDDQVWVIAKRYINGVEKRFIELITPEDFDEDWDAVRVDSSVTKDSPKTITAMTNDSPGVFTSATHGFTGGEQIKLTGVVLAKVAGVASTDVNGTYLLVYINANTFSLTTLAGAAINTTTALGYGSWVSGGEARKMDTAVSGLSHLNGETVKVQADGVAIDADFVVTGGQIVPELTNKAAVKHVGLPYEGTIQLLKLSDGSEKGTGQTKTRRIYLATLRLNRSHTFKIGLEEGMLDQVYLGNDNLLASEPTALFTGDVRKFSQTYWTDEAEIIIRQDKPEPLSLLACVLESEVSS